MSIAIITGASSGMGREFARRLEKSGNYDEIWLIARRAERLAALAGEMTTPARVLALDLTDSGDIDRFAAALAEAKPKVETLVCASGYGKFGEFDRLPLNEQLGIIDLNCRGLTAVTYLALPYMTDGGQIYELCSISAFQPVPYAGVYAASKSYVLSFTRAVNTEQKGRVHAMAVCPFWVRTVVFDRAVRDDTSSYYSRFLTSEQVVTSALKDMRRGKDVSVCGGLNKLQALACKLLPHRTVMRIWCRQQSKAARKK